MYRKIILTLALLMFPVWLVVPRAAAEDKPLVHPLFTDHMVLQRELPAPVWGWTTPGGEIKVSLGDKTATARADNTGRWQVKLGPFQAGGPYAWANNPICNLYNQAGLPASPFRTDVDAP
jgi:sialate O-acetylesterase